MFVLLEDFACQIVETNRLPLLPEGNSNKKRKKFVVIGGGWGGWGAAKALCQSGIDADVTLIDALPDPTGVSMIQQACDD
jgi:NADPH-dependent 2,4-dienoyl-CoA reductase/sulfur reductase-like enzyme